MDIFLVYSWYHLSVEAQKTMGFLTPIAFHWTADFDPTLYFDAEHEIYTAPVSGILECMEDAENEALRILGINAANPDLSDFDGAWLGRQERSTVQPKGGFSRF